MHAGLCVTSCVTKTRFSARATGWCRQCARRRALWLPTFTETITPCISAEATFSSRYGRLNWINGPFIGIVISFTLHFLIFFNTFFFRM